MKKSCSKFALVFLMIVMTLCLGASAQADTTGGTGSQGGTISISTLPPIAPAPTPIDLKLLLSLLLELPIL